MTFTDEALALAADLETRSLGMPDAPAHLAAEMIKSLLAVRGDVWDQGYEAAAQFYQGGKKGHWESNDKRGTRTWFPDPEPANPYRSELGVAE
jgi:hypothetical protein